MGGSKGREIQHWKIPYRRKTNKPINRQSSSLRLNGKIPFRQNFSCGQLKVSFRGEQGIYPSYLLTVA